MAFDWKSIIPPEVRRWWGAGAPPIHKVVRESSVQGSNLAQWLSQSPKSREWQETCEIYREAKRLQVTSPFRDDEWIKHFVLDCIVDICAERGVAPSLPLGEALWDAIAEFLIAEGFVLRCTGDDPPPHLTLEEAAELRATFRRQIAFLKDHERLLPVWRHKLVVLFAGILRHFPPSAFSDVGEDGEAQDDDMAFPEARGWALCENVPMVLDRTITTFFDQDIVSAHLFEGMRERLDANATQGMGSKEPIYPSEQKNTDPEFLLSAYFGGTPIETFFQASLPFAIPFPARFEHTHVIGGTGHGKTQLLQFLMHHDLVRAKDDQRSIIVIDSQGDLIRTMSGLRCFSPSDEQSLADRYVSIDPSDIEHPVALNMFDFNRSRLSGYAPLDREKILNATVELYAYFFGALLGAELTQRQGLIFRYLARLLMEIPGATIHTLRELMEDGERFLPYMEKLDGTARAFFATRFFDPSFRETKKQILARLWGVLSNAALERMFAHKESRIDLFDLMNSGKIIFINTAKDLLGEEGAAIFGRFFIALITQAAIQRSAIPSHERNPCFVYIDEAHEYFDANIGNLLAQARKYKVGLVLAHQSLDQLGTELRGSVLANTTIKFAGGVSAKDATAVAQELRCDSEFLLAQKRDKAVTHFACYVRNDTTQAISVSIPLGFVESLPRLSPSDVVALRDANRLAYTAPPEPVAEVSFAKKEATVQRAPRREPTPATPPAPAPVSPVPQVSPKVRTTPPAPSYPGKGGQEHKYLQHLIKRLAEERGFRATIEENILNGTGQVDVSLIRGKQKIACEISVTTGQDHELGNVEKCIAAGYSEILLVGATERHAKTLAKFIGENLEEGHSAEIRYASPDTLLEYLDGLGAPETMTETTVRGYKVKTTTQRMSATESTQRRAVIAEVVARSLTKSRKSKE